MRNLKKEIKQKKFIKTANSSMNKDDLKRVLRETNFNSSQKLISKKSSKMMLKPELMSPLVAAASALRIDDNDHVEGAMPNTAKFESSLKVGAKQNQKKREQTVTDEDTTSSQNDAQ